MRQSVASILFAAGLLLPAQVWSQRIIAKIDSRGRTVYTNITNDSLDAHRARVGLKREQFKGIAGQAAAAYGIPEDLVLAVMEVESGFNPNAVSPSGAMGLMQLMPETAEELGVRAPFDPVQNTFAGARHLKQLLQRFDGNLGVALAAYNAGENAVARHGDIPPIAETRRFVDKVMDRLSNGSRFSLSPPASTAVRTYVGANGIRYYTNIEPTDDARQR